MFFEKRYTTFWCGDETGIHFEEMPSVTMASKGARKVTVHSTGGEKMMFTVFLGSSLRLDDWGNVVGVRKEKPVVLFKGAADGPVARAVAAAAAGRAGLCQFLDRILSPVCFQ